MSVERIGRYEIRSELGRGGMATVYHAYDPRFRRDVAVKVLPREFLHDPTFRARFEREAQTIAALEHPAIVSVYDFGEEDGLPYLVMRYMSGGSLLGRLAHGPLTPLELAPIFARIAGALDEAHARGTIHRDIKPGNILFDRRGEAYLSDFGIAKLAQATASLTGAGIIGTPEYMSPEQARGEAKLDGRSDIYSLGVVLFQALTGRLPYEADTPIGVALRHVSDPVPDIRSIRPELAQQWQTVTNRVMAKQASERYPTGADLARAVHAMAGGAGPASTPAVPEPALEKVVPPLAEGSTVLETPAFGPPPGAQPQASPRPAPAAGPARPAAPPTPASQPLRALPGWRLAVGWVLALALGAGLTFVGAQSLGPALVQGFGEIGASLAWAASGLIGGAAIGLTQAAAMRGSMSNALTWGLAVFVAWVVAHVLQVIVGSVFLVP
jgi:serine/threonine-protein kinase